MEQNTQQTSGNSQGGVEVRHGSKAHYRAHCKTIQVDVARIYYNDGTGYEEFQGPLAVGLEWKERDVLGELGIYKVA